MQSRSTGFSGSFFVIFDNHIGSLSSLRDHSLVSSRSRCDILSHSRDTTPGDLQDVGNIVRLHFHYNQRIQSLSSQHGNRETLFAFS